ncbi:MAG: hypothetical protein DDT32_01759 [Syntrophomonadaceae bacterium]|nr:hypothetical protein [Bacillota bacterium]
MEDKILNQTTSFSLFCWNIANPSAQRAGKQAEWLRKRPENVLVLTEVKRSEGCMFLERYFQAYGYNVIFPKPEGNEYGVMIVSKSILRPSSFSNSANYLRSRAASVKLLLSDNELEIMGIYVPSRDSSYEKTQKKKLFLKRLSEALEANSITDKRIFCGDLNVIEPHHVPHYPFFQDWEYDFYCNLTKYKLADAFRHLNIGVQEYSWVGRTGEGYRYDHCFISSCLVPLLRKSYYLHEPRELKLSDHSALITVLERI